MGSIVFLFPGDGLGYKATGFRSSWGERTPPTYKLASGIFVLSVDSWFILMEAAA